MKKHPSLDDICKRLNFYEQTEEVPEESIQLAFTHYVQDVTILLDEVIKLRNELAFQSDRLDTKETENKKLWEEIKQLHKRLEEQPTKQDWHETVFHKPRMVGGRRITSRVTDNRPVD
jgi:predicted nuclease with TOPRIM domain